MTQGGTSFIISKLTHNIKDVWLASNRWALRSMWYSCRMLRKLFMTKKDKDRGWHREVECLGTTRTTLTNKRWGNKHGLGLASYQHVLFYLG